MAVTSYRSPGTVTEDTSVGTDVFTNPQNVKTVGGTATTISWASGAKTSSRLKCTNWGFTTSDVPAGSTINGLEFSYDRQEDSTTDNLRTSEIYHIDSSGTLQTGTNNAVTTEWPTGALANTTVGGATNLMGYTTATAADMIDVDFGISFRCDDNGAGTTPSGSIDSFQLRIYYTAPTGITFDAATNSTYQAASSSYSWSHTCTGSNLYLVVGVAMLSLAQSVSSITYAGESLALLGVKASITGACRVELWGMVAPPTGANTIAVTLTGSIASAGCAASYAGVNQSSPTEAFNSAQATNVGAADATVSVTTVADNDWVVDIVATDDTAITVGTGNTSRNNVTGAGGSGAMGDTNAAKTPAGAVTMSWTNVAALATWAIAAIAIRPTAASNLASKVFRKTFSGVGTKVGVRQVVGW